MKIGQKYKIEKPKTEEELVLSAEGLTDIMFGDKVKPSKVNQEGILDFLKNLFKKKEVKTIAKAPLTVKDIKELPKANEVNSLSIPNIKDYTKDNIPNATFAYNMFFFSKPANMSKTIDILKYSIDNLTKFVGKKQELSHEDNEGDFIYPAYTELHKVVEPLASLAKSHSVNIPGNNSVFTDGEAADTEVVTYAFRIEYDKKDYAGVEPTTIGIHLDVEYPMARMEDYGDIVTNPAFYLKSSITSISSLANPKEVYKELEKAYKLFNSLDLDKVKYVNSNDEEEFKQLNNGVREMLIHLKNTIGNLINLSIDYINEVKGNNDENK